jgi:probable biosynthetic protein (TIGR04098 family)
MPAPFSLVLGMPHLGRNNLSESALFKAIGNDRWQQLESQGKTRSALIRDEAGERLYATFFFLEVNLAPEKPLSAFGENDEIKFVRDLSHYTKVYLDGRYTLTDNPNYWIRASNVFIYQERGPSKLSLAVPINVDFSDIPELPEQPDSLALCRQAKARGSFSDAEQEATELYSGEREFVYQLDADRDLNGAGLIYFANFISFLDLAERRILTELEDPMPSSLLDARSTYYRRIGYFGNAQHTDRLHILVKTRMQNRQIGEFNFLDVAFDYRIRRSSDQKEIVISSSRKAISLEKASDRELEWIERHLAALQTQA